MAGKKPRLSPLESRKLLLIAESDLNRAQLFEEWQALKDQLVRVAARASSFHPLASLVEPLMAGLKVFQNDARETDAPRTSWFKKIVVGARLASSIWKVLRPRRSKEDKEE